MAALNIRVFGIVQGVGFRPFTAVLAKRSGVTGTVANKGSYVDIFAEGEACDLAAFVDGIRHSPPERAMVLDVETAECEPLGCKDFRIIESEHEYGDIVVSPDIATCPKCTSELFDKKDRRYLHPFINCTQCGPRLTILEAMPYDRERTTMKRFPMCPECASEYRDPASRRYDAQPVCCPECGPEVYIAGGEERGLAAISRTRQVIMQGGIAAIKGIGGFHLCCNAKDEAAVARLRKLKNRPMKPFALMMKNIETVRRECVVLPGQEELLTGWQKPILLLEKKPCSVIAEDIAPGNPTVGVMLPYAPVQLLLFGLEDGTEMSDCLVMTSGNPRGAPICRSDDEAEAGIRSFCDIILSHNRDILIRADDSVTDWLFGKPYMIRRSRGFAPLPVMLKSEPKRQVLAIGGELKNTFCISKGRLLYPSPYIGDMADIRTVKALRETVGRMCTLLEAKPEVIVCDLHPRYNTTLLAEELAKEMQLPLIKVQHHYAHILSCMAENGHLSGTVIGASFDGTGYGEDGTIWGGELLLCTTEGYERAGSVQPFKQCGGDLSAKEGWRIAAAVLSDAFPVEAAALCEELGICTRQEYALLNTMMSRGLNTVTSTSCGRLFDAASAILGIRRASTFEGEASTALMFAAMAHERSDNFDERESLPAEIQSGEEYLTLQTTQLIAELAKRYAADRSKENARRLSYLFHKALAEMLLQACVKLREKQGQDTVALSGGVFQNRLLVKLCKKLLEEKGFHVLLHSLIPPNDGGLALGQVAAAVGAPTGLDAVAAATALDT